jgi:hypothetical protein
MMRDRRNDMLLLHCTCTFDTHVLCTHDWQLLQIKP